LAANEVSERLAASCWVQCGSTGGEGIADLDPAQIRYRSRVGFQDRIITTVDATVVPCIVLPLDRTLSRSECAVFAHRHGTVGPNLQEDDRETYPLFPVPDTNYSQVFCQPLLLEWLGDDLTTPLFMPFGLNPGPVSVPLGEPLDQFDAIAVLLPTEGGAALAGDFSVLVSKHAKIEGGTTLLSVLPIPPVGP
jgi:hypothetical protein